VLNYKSTVIDNKIWKCEFCNKENNVCIMDEEEMPKTEAVSYLIEAAA
jgi:hypothetical protein